MIAALRGVKNISENKQQDKQDRPLMKAAVPSWWGRLGEKERKLVLRVSGILVLGMALMGGAGLLPSSSPATGSNQEAASRIPEPSIATSEEDLEAKLLRILSAVEGAGQVQVALSFSESASAEYVLNSDITENTSEETDDKGSVSISSQRSESLKLAEINATPVLVREYMPRLSGAVIVAEGADDPLIRERLHKATRILLGLPAHRIIVLKSE